MRGGKTWTDTDLETFHKMRLVGCTAAEIGEAVGRSAGAVRRMCFTLKTRPPKPCNRKWHRDLTADEKRAVRKMFAARASRADLSEYLGIEPNSVSLLCKHNGLGDEYTAAMRARKSRKGVFSGRVDVTDKQWRRLAEQGCTALLQAQLRAGIHWLPAMAA